MYLTYDQFGLLVLKLVRMLAYGQTAIILVGFLAHVGWKDEQIGLFMSLTLVGDVLVSLLVAAITARDILQPRSLLAIAAVLLSVSGVIFATCSSYWLLLPAAIIGVISPSGDEVGPFISLESALVAHITPYEQRAVLFAIREMLGTFGLAVGLASGGWLAELYGYRTIFWLYAVLGLITLMIVLSLSGDLTLSGEEEEHAAETIERAPQGEDETEPLMARAEQAGAEQVAGQEESTSGDKSVLHISTVLCLVFGIDSLAYGFMTNSWLVEYMNRTFGTSTTEIGQFLFIAQLISAMTSVPSVYLSNSVGPVLAIALTKFGAGSLGAIVPFTHSMRQGMACVLFRSLFDAMDVVPRNLFLTSVVPKRQTVAILSWVNIVKTMGRSVAPIGTGILAANGYLWLCFVIMGGLEWVFGLSVIGFFYKTT